MKESVYIDVGSYIQKHYLPYEGDGLFLAPATHRTKDLKKQLADNFGDDINIPKNFSVDDLKESLNEIDVNKTQTVNLS